MAFAIVEGYKDLTNAYLMRRKTGKNSYDE